MNVKIYKNKGSVYIEIDGGNADQIAKKFADVLTSGFVTELKGLMPVSENDFVAIPKEAVQECSVSEKSQDDACEAKNDSENNEGYDESLFI